MRTTIKNSFILLIDRKNRIFLIKNRENRYMIPGGVIEKGETILEGAKREFMEEVGVKITLPNDIVYYDYGSVCQSRVFVYLTNTIDYYVKNFKKNEEAIKAIKIKLSDINKIKMRPVALKSIKYGLPVIKSLNNRLFLFYRNFYPANGNIEYYYDHITNSWSDYDLQQKTDYIQWLFPMKKDSNIPKFNTEVFIKDSKLRLLVIRAVLRMVELYGYKINPNLTIEQIKPLKRDEHGVVVGLYNPINYSNITRIMRFLNTVNMGQLSSLVFLCLCYSLQNDLKFRRKIKNAKVLKVWMATQPYLEKYKDIYNIDDMTLKDSDTEQIDYDNWTVSDDEQDDSPVGPICASFRGLDYVSNSCYQDSTLTALFAIPNKFITKHILTKDLRHVDNLVCSKDKQEDYRRRLAIQEEIIKITRSMRGFNHVKYCSGLRKLIKYCKGPQPFHGGGTQDAGEFLLYLFDIFNVEGLLKERETLVTNDLSPGMPDIMHRTFKLIETSSPIISVHSATIAGYKKFNLRSLIKTVDDTIFELNNMYFDRDTGNVYRRRIEINKILRTRYLIFNVQRLHQEYKNGRVSEKRLYTIIDCPETIIVGSRILHLHAIVVHRNVHYTCYIKCDNHWYYYDDMGGANGHSIKPIGSYNRMLKSNPSAQTEGTLYFYS